MGQYLLLSLLQVKLGLQRVIGLYLKHFELLAFSYFGKQLEVLFCCCFDITVPISVIEVYLIRIS